MSGIHAHSGVVLARRGLFNAATTALFGEHVDVVEGFRWPFVENDWFALTDVDSQIDTATIGPRAQLKERITISVSLGSWLPGNEPDTEVAVFDRAFALLMKVQEQVRLETTLGGAVLWCQPASAVSAGATTNDDSGEGRLVEIAATFVCEHRIKG
jgi:hypothetical protein